MDWSIERIADQRGKVFVVTGANAGIGLATATALAKKHAKVILGCRSQDKVKAALAALKAGQADAEVLAIPLDLASLRSVREFSSAVTQEVPRIDGLINNAGVMMTPKSLTEDGFELQFGTNVLGHFALTGLLLPLLVATPGSRVVTLSSVGHWFARLDFDNLAGEKHYQRTFNYAQSKLANLVFAYELQRRLAHAGAGTISIGAHPGVTHSDLGRHNWWVGTVMKFYGQSIQQGAQPSLMAALEPGIKGGEYIGPGGLLTFKGPAAVQRSRKLAHDPQLGSRLWAAAQNLTGVQYL